MSITKELERRKAEREALVAEETADRAEKHRLLEVQAQKLIAYQAAREQELGSLGVITRAERTSMQFEYNHIAVVVKSDLTGFSVYASKMDGGEPLAVSLPGSRKTFVDPYELDAYLAEVIDRVNTRKM